jgi:hypothetical protein
MINKYIDEVAGYRKIDLITHFDQMQVLIFLNWKVDRSDECDAMRGRLIVKSSKHSMLVIC